MGTVMQSLGFPRSSANVSPTDRPVGATADPGDTAVHGAGTANKPPVDSSSSAERLISPRRVHAQPSASTTGRRSANRGVAANGPQPSPTSLRSPASGADVFHGAPLAKRPKGRWFISSCLALLFLSLGYSLWVDGLQPDQSPAGQPPAVDPMVGPQLAHVDELRRELGRLREELSLCELRASCDGLVVRQYRYAGETVAAAEPIVELAEKGSEHIALYVPQRLATKLQIGSEVNLNIVALRSQLPCRVWRFDPALQPAPAGLARYYNQNERLVVVRLVPDLRSDADAVWQGVWLGSHVRWPRSWDHPFSAPARVAEPGASRLTAAAPEGLGR